jgi:hypothetical protein
MTRNLITAMFLLFTMSSCGGQQRIANAAHAALTAITDTGQPAYRMVVAYCETEQWKIVHDPDRTVARKRAAVAKVRTKCHRIYDLFEQAAKLQPIARDLIDAAQTAEDAALALAKVDEIRKLLTSAHDKFAALQNPGG